MIWYLVFLVAAANSATARRIVGGEETTIEKHPSIVQLEHLALKTNMWSQGCAATIITNYFVVTAAHCFSLVTVRLRIRAGTTYRESGGDIHYFSYWVQHPDYEVTSGNNDITVIRLVVPLVFSPAIGAVKIPVQGSEVPDNTAVVAAGWGRTSTGGLVSPVLRDVTIFTINHELCKNRYDDSLLSPRDVTNNQICAGILDEGGKGTCRRDSGGPLYYDGVIVGIGSLRLLCGDGYYPELFTKVSSYSEWIVGIVNNDNE